ncbi:MAG: amino acid adenylation domain-containing protein [Acidobacteriota bacterium]|nr:amino acid adenylation domain-containing protein [Acidobacteriota bacterium]
MTDQEMEGFRLSPQQKRLWSLQDGIYQPAYRAWAEVRLNGPLLIDKLKADLEELVARHEILRTRFNFLPGMSAPVQMIADEASLDWTFLDMTELEPLARQTRLGQLREEEDRRVFDLKNGPVFQVSVFKITQDSHCLWLSLPALCADDRALDNLVRGLAEITQSSQVLDPDEEPMQYVDLSEWLHELLTSQDTAAGRAYWQKMDHSDALGTGLPLERPAAEQVTYEPAFHAIETSPHCLEKLLCLCKKDDVDIPVLLLTCWQSVLYQLTHKNRLVVAVDYDGRKYDDLAPLPGLFARALPLSCDFKALPRFADLLNNNKTILDDFLKWQEFYNWEDSSSDSDDSDAPLLFSFGFSYESLPDPIEAGSLSFETVDRRVVWDRVKIKLTCTHAKDQLSLRFEYDTRLYDQQIVERIAAQYVAFLACVPERNTQIDDLVRLGDAERKWLLEAFNRTAVAYSQETLWQLFEKQAQKTPDNTAVSYKNEELTYRLLRQRAVRLATHLRRTGYGPQSRVGIYMQRCPDLMVSLLGVLAAGAAYVPLDPAYPVLRLKYMINDAGISLLLTSPFTPVPEFGVETFQPGSLPDGPLADFQAPAVNLQNLAYVLYTSGSTGQPKGVMVTHGGLANYLCWSVQHYQVAQRGNSLAHTSISFDATVTGLFPALLVGRAVVLLAEEQGIEDLAASLNEPDIGLAKITPAHLEAVGRDPELVKPRETWPLMVIGGEQLLGRTLSFLQDRVPQTRIVNEYGPTETVVGCCIYDSDLAGLPPGPVPIGKPIANTELYVLSPRMQLLPFGVPGELFIGGSGLARGYRNLPGRTAEVFVPNPFSSRPGTRLYRSGDQVRFLAEGRLEFAGRNDHQVKIRGYRVELGEIESRLKQSPSVRDGVVIVFNDDTGTQRLAAYVVYEKGAGENNAALRAWLGEALPEYATPAIFVTMQSLPLTANGKVDRDNLPTPDLSKRASDNYSAPRNPLEKGLVEIWCELLNMERIGIHDNFFEMGGDSILSIQMIARAKRLGVQLFSKHLFKYQTIAELAEHGASTPLVKAEQGLISGPAPLLPIQHWFFEQEHEEIHHYNMAVLLDIYESFDSATMADAVDALLNHHDALRLRFKRTEDGIHQYFENNNKPAATPYFERRDMSSIAAAERATALESAADQIQRSLNIFDGPLFRVVWFDYGPDTHGRLLVVAHHLVVDGVSWRIILEDLPKAYKQLAAGQAVSLPPKTTSFKKWATQLVDYANTQSAVDELDDWHALADAPVKSFASDLCANTQASAATVSISLSAQSTDALLHRAPSAYRTEINDLLLTALALAFQRWNGQEGLLLGLEGHGREELFDQLDFSRTVGWLTSLFPVYLVPGNQTNPGAALKAIKEQVRTIPNHGIGFGILRYLNSDASVTSKLKDIPVPQVSFNYLGQFDEVEGSKGLMGMAQESAGPEFSERIRRANVFDFNAMVAAGSFRLNCIYSENLHTKEEAEQLASHYRDALESLIEHCCSPNAGGLTPSDVPDAALNQTELDAIVDLYENRYGIEHIYPLSPLQHGMLYHSVMAPDSGFYAVQMSFQIHGDLNIAAFKAAWSQVMDTHEVLRTMCIDLDQAMPRQIVCARVNLPWEEHDFRHLSADRQDAHFKQLIQADLYKPFNFAQPPLMRMVLVHMGDNGYRFIWTHHHAILDGWSIPHVIQDVLNCYQPILEGRSITLPKPQPYREFIHWLLQRDQNMARRFWQGYLRGFRQTTALPQSSGEKTEQVLRECTLNLTPDVFERLQVFARREKLTLNILSLGAWALLLGRYSDSHDVVFGSTGSGRPGELAGVETMVGAFIVTLPVRIKIPEDATVLPWLHQIHQEQIEREEHQYLPLSDIGRCSDLPGDMPLFESQLVYHSYPTGVTEEKSEQPKGNMVINNIASQARNSYPFRLLVEPNTYSISLIYNPQRFDSQTAQQVLTHFGALLQNLAANPTRKLCEIPMKTEEELAAEKDRKHAMKNKRLKSLKGLKAKNKR